MNHYVLLANAKDVETFATAAQADLYAAAVGGARVYTLGQLKKLLPGARWSEFTRKLAEYHGSIVDNVWLLVMAGSDRCALFEATTDRSIRRYARRQLNFLPRKLGVAR